VLATFNTALPRKPQLKISKINYLTKSEPCESTAKNFCLHGNLSCFQLSILLFSSDVNVSMPLHTLCSKSSGRSTGRYWNRGR